MRLAARAPRRRLPVAAALITPFLYYFLAAFPAGAVLRARQLHRRPRELRRPDEGDGARRRLAHAVSRPLPRQSGRAGRLPRVADIADRRALRARPAATPGGRFLVVALAAGVVLARRKGDGGGARRSSGPRGRSSSSFPFYDNLLTDALRGLRRARSPRSSSALWTAGRGAGVLRWLLPALALARRRPEPARGGLRLDIPRARVLHRPRLPRLPRAVRHRAGLSRPRRLVAPLAGRSGGSGSGLRVGTSGRTSRRRSSPRPRSRRSRAARPSVPATRPPSAPSSPRRA